MKCQSIIQNPQKYSELWELINEQPNNHVCHLFFTNSGEYYYQQLISLESQNCSLQLVEYNRLKQKYLVVAEIILTLVNFEIISSEECRKLSHTLKRPNLIGFRLHRGEQNLKFLTQNEGNFDLMHQKLLNCCAKINIASYYHFSEIIGQGAQCVVSKAQNIFTGQNMAIKGLSKPAEKRFPKIRRSIINEVIIQKQLLHPNILNIKEVFVSQTNICIVTEFLDGMNLIERMKINDRRAFRPTYFNIQLIMYQLFQAVDYMHKQGIMHRDLKPENILFRNMSDRYEIVISDFGYADKVYDPKMIYTKRCGTPGYTAPEILNYNEGDDFYNEKCDMFSLGVIFYLLLTGKCPFEGRTSIEIMEKNLIGKVNFNEPTIQNRPKEVLELLQQLLHHSPKTRISAAQALQHPYFSQKFKDELSFKMENRTNQSFNSSHQSYSKKKLVDRNHDNLDLKQYNSKFFKLILREQSNNLLEISPSILKTKSCSPGIQLNISQLGAFPDKGSLTKIKAKRESLLSQVDEKQSSEAGSSFLYFDIWGDDFDRHPSILLEYQMNFQRFFKNKFNARNDHALPKIVIFSVDN